MEDLKKKEAFIELRAQGLSFDKITRKLKVCKQTLIDWSKELEEEIGNLKAIELEALYEKYFLLKENRIQAFGKLLARINKELKKRDFSDIPTDKLLDITGKYYTYLKEEYTDPRFQTTGEMHEAKEDKRALDNLTDTAPAYRKLKIA
jgi:intein-encoded DNA endonuclease-like protein